MRWPHVLSRNRPRIISSDRGHLTKFAACTTSSGDASGSFAVINDNYHLIYVVHVGPQSDSAIDNMIASARGFREEKRKQGYV